MTEVFNGPVLEEINLTEDGGLKKRIYQLAEDENSPQPQKGQKVQAHYEGRLESTGKVFDSSYARGDPFEFTIGVGQVIKGWDIGMASMKVGEKAELVIRSDYGYGDRGAGGDIPGGATLIFKVEILKIHENEKGEDEEEEEEEEPVVSNEQLFAQASKLKEEGNVSFKAQDFLTALNKYEEALKTLNKARQPLNQE